MEEARDTQVVGSGVNNNDTEEEGTGTVRNKTEPIRVDIAETSGQKGAVEGGTTMSDIPEQETVNSEAESASDTSDNTDVSPNLEESSVTYAVLQRPPDHGHKRLTVTALIAPVAERPRYDRSKCTDARTVYLVPRYALSLLYERIRDLKSRRSISPACGGHILTRNTLFPMEDAHITTANVFSVRDVTSGSCLFVYYGGRKVLNGFEMLPPPGPVSDEGEPYRHDMFTTAIYLPYPNSIRRDGTTTFLPVATRQSRMLFVVNTEIAGAVSEVNADGGSVFGSVQMWFRSKDDMRAEFGLLQQLLSIRVLVHCDAVVAIAFTVELPTGKTEEDPATLVKNAWKDALLVSGTYSFIPVEMFVEEGRSGSLSSAFEGGGSVTVHGYFMDGMSYARLMNGEVEVVVRAPPVGVEVCGGEQSDIRVQCITGL